MIQAITDLVGDRCLAGDEGKLVLEPGSECHNERLALVLAHGAALIGAPSADRLA